MEQHIKVESLEILFHQHKVYNSWIYQKDIEAELQKIIFNNYKGVETPRFYETNYHRVLDYRFEQLTSTAFLQKHLTKAEKSFEK